MKPDAPPPRAPQPQPSRMWFPYLVLAGALLLTAVAAYYVAANAGAQERLRFENAVRRTTGDIERRLEAHVALLRAGAGLFAAEGEVTRARFHAFVERLDLPHSYPGARGIGYSRRVTASELEALTAAMRREGFGEFAVRPQGERAEYFPIVFSEPTDARNRGALGFDMFSEPVRREAMERARDEAEPAATGRVTLVQEAEQNRQAGFIIYVPVYRGGAIPATEEERRANLAGFVFSPFRADDLLRNIFRHELNPLVTLRAYDGTEAVPGNLLHESDAAEESVPRFTASMPVQVAGRDWLLAYASRHDSALASPPRQVLVILAGGLLFSLVLFFVTRSRTRARRASERHAADLRVSETRFRTLIEQSPVSTQIFSPDGRTLRVNRAWEELFGAKLEHLEGYNVLEDRQLEEKGVIEFIRRGFKGEPTAIPAILYDPEETVPGVSTHEDARRWLQAVIYPVKDEEGRVREVVLMHDDITERRRSEEAISFQARLLDTVEQAVIATDLEGRIIYWNDYAGKLYGWAAAEAVGRPIVEVTPADTSREQAAEIMESLLDGKAWSGEMTLRRRDGTTFPALVTDTPIHDDKGKLVGTVGVSVEITERKRLEAQLRARAEELSEANRLKDEFLATLSHELRTPLTAVLGWAKLLRSEQLDPKVSARALESIERNAEAQSQLINDLLDVSRIVTGKLRLTVRPITLAPVIEAAAEGVRPAAAARGVRLGVSLDQTAGHVSGDSDRLQQVFWNLLSNAIKFTPREGSVEVRLARAGDSAEVSIADTGAGIAPEFLPYIFERFRQADGAITREHGGLGLGLAIARHLVELHGGTIRAESAGEGRGATFIVSLPLLELRKAEGGRRDENEAGEDAGQQSAVQHPHSAILWGLRVLVVDDDDDSRLFVSTALKAHGAQVTLAASAAEAYVRLKETRPDVMVSDIGMPVVDGFELMRKIRALGADEGGRTPAAALTAYARPEDREQALAAGYQLHIAKPADPAELATLVAGLAGRKRK
ncbi:MAG TPA: CHASE domain-containing protein [Pyrinomonadaceae bacterium]|nr:CHASE domain-containing protein [Pyrinomonadaceae bacterium]